MQGVEILTSVQVTTEWAFNWTAFWIAFGVIFVVGIFAMIMTFIQEGFYGPVLLIVCVGCAILGSMLGVLFGTICETPATYETQYKVTISDEVSMTEFYEHYEVIEQDGKIFTVREKTNESN